METTQIYCYITEENGWIVWQDTTQELFAFITLLLSQE